MKRYIENCLMCAQHDSITRFQSLYFIIITYSFQLMKMNFINSFNIIIVNKKYIFNLNCYMFRFNVSFAYKNNNIENVIRCLKFFFIIYRKLYIFYVDLSYHFDKEL